MYNKKLNKKISLPFVIVAIVLLGILLIGSWQSDKNEQRQASIQKENYLSAIKTGDDNLSKDNLVQAKQFYQKALAYKVTDNNQAKTKLDKCTALMKYKTIYQNGITELNDGKYLDAIDKFNDIPKDDTIRYTTAQAKITEAKAKYVSDEINTAKKQREENQYTNAISSIDSALKINPDDSNLKSIKSQYQNDYTEYTNKQNEEAEAQKKAEEAKQAEELKKTEEAKQTEAQKQQGQGLQQSQPSNQNNSDTNKSLTVYITKTGKKYHRAGCRYLHKSDIPITLGEAESEGYSACSVCDPPQ